MPLKLVSIGAIVLAAFLSQSRVSQTAIGQTPQRTAFEILEVGRWSNPPKKITPLVVHRTYHSAAMNCDVGYSIYLPPNYADATARYPVVYWLPGGGCTE